MSDNNLVIGKRFGMLLVKDVAVEHSAFSSRKFNAVCDCGKSCTPNGRNLIKGYSKSCGCVRIKHRHCANGAGPHRSSFTYHSWKSVIARCRNKNSLTYKFYGAVGIDVCERWLKFENFLTDMGERPSKDYSIDRIDNSLGYFPGNCRWATRSQQCRNQRSNRIIEFRGESLTLAEWVERTGLTYACIWMRLYKHGYSVEKALTSPLLNTNGKPKN